MTRFHHYLTAATAACCFALVATPAQAVDTTFTFTGSDGSNAASATLVLSDYTQGAAITADNFVSFTYSSDDVAPWSFVLSEIWGNITAGQANDFSITGASGRIFSSNASGTWSYIGLFATDVGLSNMWTVPDSGPVGAVPEAATWAMMLAGFGMVGFAMRQRKGMVRRFA